MERRDVTVPAEPPADSSRRIKLRYPGRCRLCGTQLPANRTAIFEADSKTVRCVECPGEPAALSETHDDLPPVVEPSAVSDIAGSSARREYERRKANDEQRLRQRWGRLGGVAVALSSERQSTAAWDRGAAGEERLGALLDSIANDHLAVLHDRRVPGSRANFDHIIVTSAAIWVVDAKRYTGRPQLRIDGGVLRPRVENLLVGGRDRRQVVDGVLKQVDVVQGHVGDLPVRGALCFVGADWPLIGGAFTTRRVEVLWPKRPAKILNEQPTGVVDVGATHQMLASVFHPA